MGKAEKNCPTCYHKLPAPQDFLNPYDTELNYFMWMPGFEWKPKPVAPKEYDSEAETEQEQDEDMEELLQELVEQNELQEKFNAKATSNRINVDDACVLARQLGLAPSAKDAQQFREEHGDAMDLNTFEQFAAKSTHPEDNIEELATAFAHFDPSRNGFLSVKQMRNILMTWGEPMTAEEFAVVQSKFFGREDPVDYRRFCEMVLARE